MNLALLTMGCCAISVVVGGHLLGCLWGADGFGCHVGGFAQAVFELFEDGSGVFGVALQFAEDAVAHFKCCFEGFFLTAVLAVRKVFGELVPATADAQSPALKGGGLVGVSRDVSLCHSELGLYVVSILC